MSIRRPWLAGVLRGHDNLEAGVLVSVELETQ